MTDPTAVPGRTTAPGAAGAPSGNPLLARSPLPYELPPFEQIGTAELVQAIECGMVEQRAAVEAVATDPAPPGFDNTLVALERAAVTLNRALAVFFALRSTRSTPELREAEARLMPALTAHQDGIRLDPRLFARIEAVHARRHDLGLDAESIRLVEQYRIDFVLAGAQLDEADRATLRELNQRIAVAETAFGQNLLAADAQAALRLADAAALAGAGDEAVAAAHAAAAARGLDGYLVPLVAPTQQPLLAVLTDRASREQLFRASVDRARAADCDNRPVAAELAELRARRAALLGFASYADLAVADAMAKTAAEVDALLTRLVQPAVANAAAEAARTAERAAADGVELAPWDHWFYLQRIRAEEYAVDAEALRSYFELERVVADGVFYAAEQVYGITFHRRSDLTGYHPDVRVFEVFDADGTPLGLYLADYFSRDGKRGGAWMSSFVEQSDLLGQRPVVYNSFNITRPGPGEPALLSLEEVRTLFHEFGHALHGLFSRVRYPRFSGTSVPRDFVEFPSQVNEMWARWPQVLNHYARHVETGEPLDPESIAAVERADLWGEGAATVEYLSATLLDQAWHRIPGDHPIVLKTADEVDAFEEQALAEAGIVIPAPAAPGQAGGLVPPRYRTAYFQHIFSNGYEAGYYSYIWSEVLDADTVDWFAANGGMSRTAGDRFRAALLSVGGSVDPLQAFRDVVGRDPAVEPLLRRRGLGTAPTS